MKTTALLVLAYLLLTSCVTSTAPSPTTAAPEAMAVSQSPGLKWLVTGTRCIDHKWKNRGEAPASYIYGMALTYARAVCNMNASDVKAVYSVRPTDPAHDAFDHYSAVFKSLGMKQSDPKDRLRHAYTLLIGLGMRESSGEHCCGRDSSATNVDAETSEAGLFQTSYNSRSYSAELPKLFTLYKTNGRKCHLDEFKTGVSCSDSNWKNWGSGEGVTFQKMEKECPSFAVDYAAVMIRFAGGSKGHYGPLRTRAAEVLPECDSMLLNVQKAVEENPSLCKQL